MDILSKGLILAALISISCSCKKEMKKESLINNEIALISNYKRSIIFEGNKQSYDNLFIYYVDYPFSDEIFIYAFVMATKYNYPQAYFDLYSIISHVHVNDIDKIDENTAELALHYLKKAASLGHHQAEEEIKQISNRKTNSKYILKELWVK